MLSRSYSLGLIFIGLVALIWALSSVLVQYLYTEQSFSSPFLLTYIGVSLFSLWIPFRQLVATLQKYFHHNDHQGSDHYSEYEIPSAVLPGDVHEADLEGESDVIHTAIAGSNATTRRSALQVWDDQQHFRVACWIAPVWFLANWTYNASLAYTSITSSTVLASTGSLFTFLFALLTRDEGYSGYKLAGVLLGMLGSSVTALNDAKGQNAPTDGRSSLWGDLLGLISAVGYGAYAVQTRVLCPHDESLYSMQLLLGYIGCLNMIILCPIALWEVYKSPDLSMIVVGYIVLKGLFDNVLSDWLWLRAVILTNATVATVGLGLTIPLAFISDVLLGKVGVMSANSVLGAFFVLVSFVLVNVANRDEIIINPVEIVSAVDDDEEDEEENVSLSAV